MPQLPFKTKHPRRDGRAGPVTLFRLLVGMLFSGVLACPAVSTAADLGLTLEIAPYVTEREGTYGFVRLAVPTPTTLKVALSSSDPTVLGVPVDVTMLPGWDGGYFYLSPVNNTEPNLSRSVTLTASAPGYSTATAELVVRDDDLYSATWTAIDHPQQAGVSFDTEVLFQTLEGLPAGDLSLPVTVSVANEHGSADFTEMYAFQNPSLASRTSTMTITSAGQQTRLVVTYADGKTAQSAPFVVAAAGAVPTDFRWEAIGDPQQAGEAFPVVLRATDKFGNPRNDFTGTAHLSALRDVASLTFSDPLPWPTTMLGYPGSSSWRTTALFLASELGVARTLRTLAIEFRVLPSTPLEDFTIRIKHSSSTGYPDYSPWDNTGWTTICEGTVMPDHTGWHTFRLSSPFAYDGVSSLLVDISFNNPEPSTSVGIGDLGAHYTTYAYTISPPYPTPTSGDPKQWTSQGRRDFNRPNVRFNFGEDATISPSETLAFVNGVWSSQVSIAQAGANTVIAAESGGMHGESEPFAIFGQLPASILAPEPLWTGGFANTLNWTRCIGAGCYQLQRGTDMVFSDAIDAPLTAGTSFTFTGLLDGSKYFYRVRPVIVASGGQSCTGPWSAVIASTQDASAPVITVDAPAIVTSSAYTLGGTATDLSGISLLTVNGTEAATTDSFAHWACPVTLQLGMNTLTISARDVAILANSATTTAKILHIPSTGDINGDPDGDGLSDLMEYALGLDPATADSVEATYALISTSGIDQRPFLAFAYRKRHSSEGLSYHVETSSDLVTWTEVVDPEVLYTYIAPGGGANMIVVRASSALDATSPRLFARLKITVP